MEGPAEHLTTAACLALHTWTWQRNPLPLDRVRGPLPAVPVTDLTAEREENLLRLTRASLEPRVAGTLAAVVAEVLRNPNRRFALLDRSHGRDRFAVLWGLHGIFGELLAGQPLGTGDEWLLRAARQALTPVPQRLAPPREVPRRPADDELLRALSRYEASAEGLPKLLAEVCARLADWPAPLRRRLCAVLLERRLLLEQLAAGEPDNRVAQVTRLYRHAVRPFAAEPWVADRLRTLLPELWLASDGSPAARRALREILSERPGLPEEAWVALFRAATRTPPTGRRVPAEPAPAPSPAEPRPAASPVPVPVPAPFRAPAERRDDPGPFTDVRTVGLLIAVLLALGIALVAYGCSAGGTFAHASGGAPAPSLTASRPGQ
ncbi:hypothetical protein [Streptomyces hainanensis]|uniref:Uncharacterized protein n=1 Tax=Streptomyces hainanensis TaxID=402648 RepID=A0A4R4T9X4_9ACTN|nr:hypothetical protein [Streptomyces hainanensis]TDC74061.1 hypothetical protein E1283_17115 [Streptomyces hainanensis]